MNFKILILGYGSDGKTSFIQRHKTGEFKSVGEQTTALKFYTNYGSVLLQVKESNFYEDGHDAEIIMFDLTRLCSMDIVDDIPKTNKPRVVVGNKCDLKDG